MFLSEPREVGQVADLFIDAFEPQVASASAPFPLPPSAPAAIPVPNGANNYLTVGYVQDYGRSPSRFAKNVLGTFGAPG
jgi:hypothetical protein